MRLFLRTCKLCTLQYSVVRPTTALVTLALASAGQYREGDFSIGSAYVVVTSSRWVCLRFFVVVVDRLRGSSSRSDPRSSSSRRVAFVCASSSIVFVALLLDRIRVRRHLVALCLFALLRRRSSSLLFCSVGSAFVVISSRCVRFGVGGLLRCSFRSDTGDARRCRCRCLFFFLFLLLLLDRMRVRASLLRWFGSVGGRATRTRTWRVLCSGELGLGVCGAPGKSRDWSVCAPESWIGLGRRASHDDHMRKDRGTRHDVRTPRRAATHTP